MPKQGTKAPWYLRQNYVLDFFSMKLGAVDEVVKEPAGGAQKNHKAAAAAVKKAVLAALAELADVPADDLVAARYAKFRAMGNFY